ncbi:DnaA ATPase domain-containing protein [Mammaliicoccus sciuri]|uniref:DnaA ATPase domain-containing protein n=1 Tax=Mammaliicoccus sciuri TaxID=1296 RepID=UPI001FB4206C|nr:DnaA/Hda family protein [Mammaliicoccus sciuri]MCJ0951028.1 DnaA/Hda family protein [Mammaliicoccus sciuri]
MIQMKYREAEKGSPVTYESDSYICSGCGRIVSDIKHENGYEWSYNCHCNLNELAKSNIKHFEKINRDKYFKKSLSFIPKNFQNTSFNKYEPENSMNDRASRICQRYAANFDLYNPQSLFIFGDYGTGKSMLAASIMNEVRKNHRVMYLDINLLLNNITMSWNSNTLLAKQNYQETMLQLIRTADLVIFDDVGASANYKTQMSLLLTIIQSRLGKHNIYTTNLDQKELSTDKDWERIFSRMMENTTPIEMRGTDRRRKGKFKDTSSNVTKKAEKKPDQKTTNGLPYDISDPPF